MVERSSDQQMRLSELLSANQESSSDEESDDEEDESSHSMTGSELSPSDEEYDDEEWLVFTDEADDEEDGLNHSIKGPELPPREFRDLESNVEKSKLLHQLVDCPFFWGSIDATYATDLLFDQPVGAFLLRDSMTSEDYLLSLSFRVRDRIMHVRLEHDSEPLLERPITKVDQSTVKISGGDILIVLFEPMVLVKQRKALWNEVHSTLNQYMRAINLRNNAPVTETSWYPITRTYMVHSLMHLSRAALRKLVTIDKIPHLNLPSTLLAYMLDMNYLLDELGPPPPVDTDHGITNEQEFTNSWIPKPPPVPPRAYKLLTPE